MQSSQTETKEKSEGVGARPYVQTDRCEIVCSKGNAEGEKKREERKERKKGKFS
jgi:hypothetical protein